jgi:hypothetical protein
MLLCSLVIFGAGAGARAAELKILLPLQRTAYQTNERIDLAVVRSDKAALPAGDLLLSVKGEDGSMLAFTFPVKQANARRAVEHLHLNGWYLRPGKYTIEAAADGATAKTGIEVYSHVRKSSFRLINWGRAKGKAQLPQGEENLGYNLFYGHYGQDEEGNFIRAGVDFMSNCTMSGGHQMDLRLECDWSDPLVIRGGTRRVVKRAFMDRSRGNVPGVHFYDEPGLTWMKHPKTGENSPQGIPSQLAAYEAAFGHPLKDYFKIDPKNPRDVALWRHWARWKLGFMDAAWKDADFGVRYVRPDFLSVTQSQYGYSAFTDGYYFNVVRSLPVISGHGGYHDYGPGYFNPSMFLELARARDFSRPNWYLPTWYGNTTSDQFRLEQYLSFQTNIQGMMSPPDLEPGEPDKCKAVDGIVESNHLMGRLGTIFSTMPVTRPPVAVLYSLSQMIKKQTEDMKVSYAHDTAHGRNLVFTYLAGKLLQHQFMTVVEEDIVDGTLAANHKALILTSIDYLDPKVIGGLEQFIEQGGLVLMTGDSTVKIKGAVKIGVTPGFPDAAKIAALTKAGKTKEAAALTQMRQALAGARVLADALKPPLEKAGIMPVFVCDQPGICATRQAAGDIEYLFAVNATHDPQGDPMLGVKAVTANLAIPAVAGTQLYDAVHGSPIKELKPLETGHFAGKFRFGPGQMRVFARTAKPIGGIKTSTPVVGRDYTAATAPIHVDIAAALVDNKGYLLSGSAPVRVRLIDPLGTVRYDLFRATSAGVLKLRLPLAVNDPAGEWKVDVVELLSNTHDTAPFMYRAVSTASAAAGATRRAVHLAGDREPIYRLFRVHGKVTIVKGSSDYHQAAAERLVKILKPWNVQATIANAAEVNKPRSLTAEEAQTWVGLNFAGKGQIKPGDKNPPALVGFAVQGPVILLGSPEDNPLIKMLQGERFLPYTPNKADFPGPNRGYIAWQRDGIGVLQESITLIAYDAKGLNQAVGNLYEIMAGMDPLTPLVLPQKSSIAVAKNAPTHPPLIVDWSIVLPDRIAGIKVVKDRIDVVTHAGIKAAVSIKGNVDSRDVVDGDAYQKLVSELSTRSAPAALADARKHTAERRLVKFAVAEGKLTAVAYWGGTLRIIDNTAKIRGEHVFGQDLSALAWAGEGFLIAGDADGRLIAVSVK